MDRLIIRPARADDAVALLELAVIDDAEQLEGEVLVAEVDGRPWAALELDGGRAVADPFRPSGELVELLRVRRAGLYAGPARWSIR